jgi:hypothetical protein
MRDDSHRGHNGMKRRLLNFLTLASLLLCVAAAATWARSYWRMDQIVWWSPDRAVAAYYDHGRVYLAAVSGFRHSNQGWERVSRDVAGQPGVWERDAAGFNSSVSLLGFGYGNADRVMGIAERLRLFTVPHWFLFLAFAILPAARGARALRRRRRLLRAAGLCVRCGYDLRATPQRCPECGASAASAGPEARPSAGSPGEGEARLSHSPTPCPTNSAKRVAARGDPQRHGDTEACRS